jgi:hypothetical protein
MIADGALVLHLHCFIEGISPSSLTLNESIAPLLLVHGGWGGGGVRAARHA